MNPFCDFFMKGRLFIFKVQLTMSILGPGHASLGSGSVARHCVKQLEAMKVLEKSANGGRQITSTGRRDLDRIAQQA